jgi:mRNA-degrading endonuclease RelE of RelBE toxin-antitoxin system
MNWACELTDDSKEDLNSLPKAVQKRVSRVIDQMQNDPFQGDVKALHGEEWKGIFRRRVGDYRVLFLPDWSHQVVRILRIVIRSGQTYR